MSARGLLLCALLGGGWLSLCSCERQATTATQLIVSISAEPALASRLKRVRAVVLPKQAKNRSGKEPAHAFSLLDEADAGTRVSMPFSFGISRGSAESLLLIIEGFDSTSPEAPVVIEHKLIASFAPGITRQLNVLLRDACYNNLCAPLTETCAVNGCAVVRTGSVLEPRLVPLDAAVDAAADGEAVADAQVVADVQVDARPEPDPVAESDLHADDADGGSTVSACAQPDVCMPDYPCVETRSGGYTCQGHFADWPVPSTVAGAKLAPSYDYASKPGVVIDRVTELQWQRDVPKNYPGCSGKATQQGDTCTLAEAMNYCHQLDLDGGLWRLPSKVELESLLTHPSLDAVVAPDAFPGLEMDHMFWTRSSASDLDGWGWIILSSISLSIPSDPMSPNHVRCVRAGATGDGVPTDRYRHEVSSNSVTDTRTRLEWQRDFGAAQTIEDARAYCVSRGDGFRLPGLNELLTLVDPTRSEPAVDQNVFPDIGLSDMFWTASQAVVFEGEPPEHLLVEFAVGSSMIESIVNEPEPDVSLRVRCVR